MTGPTDNSQSLFFFGLFGVISEHHGTCQTHSLALPERNFWGVFWVILVLLGLCASTAVSLSTAGAEILVFY